MTSFGVLFSVSFAFCAWT